jgi:hypothetical protein
VDGAAPHARETAPLDETESSVDVPVRILATTGPAGPHMILFDPSIPLAHGEH